MDRRGSLVLRRGRALAVAAALALGLVPAPGAAWSVSHTKHVNHRHHHVRRHHTRSHASHPSSGTRASQPAHDGLDAGEATFWNGPTVASGNVQDPGFCGTAAGACQTYSLRLNEAGERLRVALDTPMRSN